MKITRINRKRTDNELAAIDTAMQHERECLEAWHAARSAKPFDKAVEAEAFEAYLRAEAATMEVSR